MEKFLGKATSQDVELDCYGQYHCDGVEVIQVTVPGSLIDLYDVLKRSTIMDLESYFDLELLKNL